MPAPPGCSGPEASKATIFRFLPNGQPDLSFGLNGQLSTDFGLPAATCKDGGSLFVYGSPQVQVTGLAIDADDRPVLTGRFVKETGSCDFFLASFHRAFLARLGNSGTFDTSFAGTGIRIDESIFSASEPFASPLGGTVFQASRGPECERWGFSTRVLGISGVTGALETSFGSGGIKAVGLGGPFELPPGDFGFAGKIAVDGRGRILLLEHRTNPPAVRVVRLSSDGQVDQSFGHSGTAVVSLPAKGEIQAIAVDPQGRVLLAGQRREVRCRRCDHEWERGPAPAFILFRLQADGRQDKGFGRKGLTQSRFPGFGANAEALAQSVLIDGSRRIRVAGVLFKRDPVASETSIALARFSGNASPPHVLALRSNRTFGR
jgi:uncharacterized delta-60 repeat protein